MDPPAELARDPTAFEFFQAVRLLERAAGERRRVGGFGDPEAEVVRFSAHAGIAFPASEIQALAFTPGAPARMTVNFLGLIGPLGVLPYHYTLLVAERLRARDRALQAFLDIFHHRITSLFYRAWEKHHFTVAYERDRRDAVSEHLHDLVGLGITGFRDRLPVRDESLLFYAGLLAAQPRSAVGLEQLLSDYFGVPVEVDQFVGGWYPLGVPTQCSVGAEAGPADQVGLGAVVGDEVWDQQARVRLRLGPLTRAQYDAFLPTGPAYAALSALTRLYCHDRLDFELQLVLARDDVPACVLGADDRPAAALGWGTWVRTAPFPRDADDTILALGEGARP
ncbi:MAG: type VI secretion system baseplate subunit TssG [Gemmatimonadales bacterium]